MIQSVRRATALLGGVALWGVTLCNAVLCNAVLCDAATPRAGLPSPDVGIERQRELAELRQRGDLKSERRHVWRVFAQLTDDGTPNHRAPFATWYGEDVVFAKAQESPSSRGMSGFSRASDAHATSSADAPVLTYTLYNDAAFQHIRTHRLYLQSELQRLQVSGPQDSSIAGDRMIPPFPADAMVLKTAWWPVARDGLTALPVWDPAQNPPRRGGNDYLTWSRVVALDPLGHPGMAQTAQLDFAGRSMPNAHRISLRDIHHIVVDADLAARLHRDRGLQKLALIVLGRPIAAGDYLALVGGNLATKEIDDWVWAAFWWHDRPNEGPFAAERPAGLGAPWQHYLLQVAFDADKPAEPDGTPHICFNPWLEGRFPAGSAGGGTASNCMACHGRASYPPVDFLPVTRGAADVSGDSSYAPHRLRTSFNWSIALHANP